MDDTESKLRKYRQLFKHQQALDRQPARWKAFVAWVGLPVVLLGLLGVYLFFVRHVWQHAGEELAPQAANRANSSPVRPMRTASPAEESLDALYEQLRDVDLSVQRHAMAELGQRRPVNPRSVRELTEALVKGSLHVQAAEALGEMGFEAYEAAEPLAKLADETPNRPLRRAAVGALLRIDPFRVVTLLAAEVDESLTELLQDPDPWTRRYARYCLEARQSRSSEIEPAPVPEANDADKELDLDGLGSEAVPSVPDLIKRLGDGEGLAQRQVIDTLRSLGPAARDAAGPLKNLKPDNEWSGVRIAVAVYCIDPTPQHLDTAWKLIEPRLPDGISETRENSLSELLDLRPAPVELLVQVLGASRDSFTRRLVTKALIDNHDRLEPHVQKISSLLRHPPAPPQTFDDDRYETASLAADVLASVGPPASPAIDALIEQLESSSWRIRRSASRAIGRIAAPETAGQCIAALRPLRTQPHGELRAAAEFALRRIGVTLGPALAQLPLEDRVLITSVTPYSVLYASDPHRNWRPPADPVVDPPRPPPAAGTLADLLEAVRRWRQFRGNDIEQLLLSAGEGSAAVRPAVPLLLPILYEEDGHSPSQRAAIHAIWRLTRSPLVAAIMVDCQIVAPETIREMGPLAGGLGPFLLGPRKHVGSESFDVLYSRVPGWLSISLIGPRAEELLPQLRVMLEKSDGGAEGSSAALSIWRIKHDLAVIPELVRQLKPQHVSFLRDERGDGNREYVAWALGRIGPPAKEAIPLLAEVAYTDSREFGVAAAWAVGQIDPEAAKQWGLVLSGQ